MQTGNIGRLIAMIAAGASLADAAAASNMSKRTAQRRLVEPEIQLEVQDARADLARQALGQLLDLRAMAFQCIRDTLQQCDDARLSLRAAEVVLRHAAAADTVLMSEDLLGVKYQLDELKKFLGGGEEAAA